MSQANICPGPRVTHSTSPICMQPYMDLEAIVALYRVLRDICAGAQVDLAIQFIRLKQEDPPRSTWAPWSHTPHTLTLSPSPFQDPSTQAPHLLGGGVPVIFEA